MILTSMMRKFKEVEAESILIIPDYVEKDDKEEVTEIVQKPKQKVKKPNESPKSIAISKNSALHAEEKAKLKNAHTIILRSKSK